MSLLVVAFSNSGKPLACFIFLIWIISIQTIVIWISRWQYFSVLIKHYWDIFQINLFRCKVTALAIFPAFHNTRDLSLFRHFSGKVTAVVCLSNKNEWVDWLSFKTLIIIRQNFSRVRSPLQRISMSVVAR